MFFFFTIYILIFRSLNFINDLFIIFRDKIRTISLLPTYSNILEYENFINKYIYIFLLGWISALDELQFDTGERRHLSEQLLNSSQVSSETVHRGLLFYLLWRLKSDPVKIESIISSSLELLYDRFSNKSHQHQECLRRTDMAWEQYY